ncbi:MAG TPA: diguanylate cyclase [Cellulomonas sp.]|uniref:diguanylate cyclase domain-containing protein n=1 Tax=Cellulomonas sp. TaxID=40001 RepID=UPI002E32DAAC|nr:diguanylate cyclase [Cellulomonas sp.]HEX5333191.1 diguanylate cyclase [Cellulomonas sp.]
MEMFEGSTESFGSLVPAGVPDCDDLYSRNLLDAAEEVIYFKDLDSRFVRVSLGCAQLHRRTQDEMVGLTDFDLFDVSHARAAFEDEQRIIRTGEAVVNKEERERWNGRPDTWVASSKFPFRAPDGTITGTFGISRDVTRRVLAEQESARLALATRATNRRLTQVEGQLRSVLDGSTDTIARYDLALRYRYINPAGERLRGLRIDELRRRTDREIGMQEHALALWEPALRRVIATGRPEQVEFWLADESNQGQRWHHTTLAADREPGGAVVGVLASTRDITELKLAEQALAHQAMHDHLTGLANRHLLMKKIEQALERLNRAPHQHVLFFVDVDNFKSINDTYGHDRGDKVLVQLAERLTTLARRDDTVARLGGDEFVILCEGVSNPAHIRDIGARFVAALAEPYRDGTTVISVSASVGAAMTDDPASSPSDLLSRADGAMYLAKTNGRNQFHLRNG